MEILYDVVIIIGVIFFSFLILIAVVSYFVRFNEVRKFIKMEINRTDRTEQLYWKKELRHHYLCLIPFVRFFKHT